MGEVDYFCAVIYLPSVGGGNPPQLLTGHGLAVWEPPHSQCLF